MKRILLTNDDGIESEGLLRLAKVASKFGEVWIVAPDSERSGVSHGVSFRHSFDAWEVDYPLEGVRAYACSGTPADCVRVGLLNIVKGDVDHVFSGINYGYNVASDIQYSATAGAAFEAAFQKKHTIAFSEHSIEIHEVADRYLEEIMAELMEKPLNPNEIWNVNFPGCSLAECKGIKRDTKVSLGLFYKDYYKETKVDEKKTTYMVEGVRNWEAEEGTDLRAVLDDFISVGKACNIS